MKVRHLIELLQKFDGNLEVYFLEQPMTGGDGDFYELSKMNIKKEDNLLEFLNRTENKFITHWCNLSVEPVLVFNHKGYTYEEIEEVKYEDEEKYQEKIEVENIEI